MQDNSLTYRTISLALHPVLELLIQSLQLVGRLFMLYLLCQ